MMVIYSSLRVMTEGIVVIKRNCITLFDMSNKSIGKSLSYSSSVLSSLVYEAELLVAGEFG